MTNEKRPAVSDRAPSTTSTLCLKDTADGLDVIDAERLTLCESVIDRGLRTFIEVGDALMAIRDGRLYRRTHGTFDAYCRERWGWTASRARQLMGAAETATNVTLSGGTAPATESQARELTGLTAAQAAIVMRVAHERSGGNVTAAAIRAARMQPWTESEITTAIDGYLIHPLIAMFPAFQPREWERFAASVGRIGLLMPITLSPDGTQIVDGRFRYLALRWNGIEPETAAAHGGDPAFKRLGAGYSEEKIDSYIISVHCFNKSYTEDEITAAEARIRQMQAVAR